MKGFLRGGQSDLRGYSALGLFAAAYLAACLIILAPKGSFLAAPDPVADGANSDALR